MKNKIKIRLARYLTKFFYKLDVHPRYKLEFIWYIKKDWKIYKKNMSIEPLMSREWKYRTISKEMGVIINHEIVWISF